MLPPSRRWVLLLAASLGFYAVGSPQALPLLAGITLGTSAAGTGHRKKQNTDGQKALADLCGSFVHRVSVPLQICGSFRTDVPLLLPAGISFYTFQTLSYVIDLRAARAGRGIRGITLY